MSPLARAPASAAPEAGAGSPPDSITITLADSVEFARLSGDFNPMHVDPVRARRTQYGSTVVHGMHLLLASLDVAVSRGLLQPRAMDSLSVVFSNPALTGAPVRLVFNDDHAQGRFRILGEHEGRTLFSATLGLQDERAEPELPPDAQPEPPAAPTERMMPTQDVAVPELGGSVPWQLCQALFDDAFAALARAPGGRAVGADLLASTRVVGMECPGLHSIYSTLKLKRVSAGTGATSAGVRWRVTRSDARFRLVRLAVTGGFFEGAIDAFFRPPPVVQASLSALLQQVRPDAFAGHRALVVGGSRGLGELTAKLLLAGGADVTISYVRGAQDGERVCLEARALGRRCDHLALDLRRGPTANALPETLRGAYSLMCYFASPQIGKGTAGQWRAQLFDEFAAVYLQGFTDLLAALVPVPASSTAVPLRVLYPSTVFLDSHEKGFAEYCAAKAAGEVLCDHLAAHYGIRIDRPRLPRMHTDQTSGLMATDTADALPVMRRALAALCDAPDAG